MKVVFRLFSLIFCGGYWGVRVVVLVSVNVKVKVKVGFTGFLVFGWCL